MTDPTTDKQPEIGSDPAPDSPPHDEAASPLPADAGTPPDPTLPADAGTPPDPTLPADAGTPPDPTLPADAGTPPDPTLPDYKGAPIDPERGPGLGCFWFQVGLLVFLLIATPLSVYLAAPPWFSAAMLIILLVLLFFVGQTMIFLLRLVAADRRTRRRPISPSARRTVGQMEDASVAPPAPASNEDHPRPG